MMDSLVLLERFKLLHVRPYADPFSSMSNIGDHGFIVALGGLSAGCTRTESEDELTPELFSADTQTWAALPDMDNPPSRIFNQVYYGWAINETNILACMLGRYQMFLIEAFVSCLIRAKET